MNSHTDSELEDIDISNSELRSRSDFEDSDRARNGKLKKKKQKSKHQLVPPKGGKKRQNKKKKKGIKLNSKIWQTIVLSHSPREDESMLFEEGTDVGKDETAIEMGQPKSVNIGSSKE